MSGLHRRISRAFRVAVPIAAGSCSICLLALLLVVATAKLEVPAPTRLVLDRHGQFLCEVRDGGPDAEAGYWPLDPVPSRIAATVIALEDRRFHLHPGVDPIAVLRAGLQNFRNRCVISGASTLAMQVTRLQKPAERTLLVKLAEMIRAVAMTLRYGRERIMDQYLRLAPYGNGIRGIGYAAQCYFGKPPEDLSWAEIAFLSAIPQQPNRMNPRTGSGRIRVVQRARRIIEIVRELGYMTAEEAARARMQVADIVLEPRPAQPAETIHLALRFRELLKSKTGRPIPDACVLKTGIDRDIQTEVVRQAGLCLETWKDSGAGNTAVMIIDNRDRSVLAAMGSTDYFDSARAGSIDYTRVSRSPGSTLKPFIYALAMENGIISPESVLPDRLSHAGGFRNFDDVWLGDIPVHRALAASRNVPAVELLRRTGVHRTYGCFAELGLHRYESNCDRFGLGMAVGGLPVTMERLVQAFTVFSDRGRMSGYKWYDDQELEPGERIFSVKTVQWINRTLSDPMARLPSFPRMGNLEYDYPVAVKTGTSEGCRDAWTIAWSPDYMIAVWMGRPDGGSMRNVSGYRASAELARVLMDRIHAGGSGVNKSGSMFFEDDPGSWSENADNPNHSVLSGESPDRPVTPREPAEAQEVIRIISPEAGAVYYFDPDVPPGFSAILFSANIEPAPAVVTWEVDGLPFATVGPPYMATWSLQPGEHRIRIRIPSSGSTTGPITISVNSTYASAL